MAVRGGDGFRDPLPCTRKDVSERRKVGALQHGRVDTAYVIETNLQ